jgi:transposase
MRGAVHTQIRTIGLDIAKNVFQVHGIDIGEKVVVRKQLRRRQVLATVGTGCGFAIEMRPV